MMRWPRETRERGQVLVVFTLALLVIVAMTGLVLDGGSTFVQRRDQQNVADAAAMAGAYAYLNTGTSAAATSAAAQIATANGYTPGSGGVVVDVRVGPDTDDTDECDDSDDDDDYGACDGTTVIVTVTKPHANAFSGLLGFASWDVTTTATAIAGAPNGAVGAMPIIFNQKAFETGKTPANEKSYDEPGTGPQDVPQNDVQFNWTVFCTATGNPCNGNSNTVRQIIDGNGTSTVVTLGMDIGPLNAGAHADLFSALANHVPADFPVAVVDDEGKMVGWAVFHLTGSIGGSTKQIRGYFVSPVRTGQLKIVTGVSQTGTSAFGAYVVQLIN